MADIYHTGPEAGGAGHRVARLTQIAGALTSLALIVGIGVGGTKMIMRDVSGIPVVEAIEGPMRVAPDQPGGDAADHQGLSVNDVAGLGTAVPPPDTLRLAPPPVMLDEEDVALGVLREAEEAPEEPRIAEAQPALPDFGNGPEMAIQALADRIAADTAPLSPLAPVQARVADADLTEDSSELEVAALDDSDILAEPEPEPFAADEDAEADFAVQLALSEALGQGGVIRSLRPKGRPSGGVQLAAAGTLALPAVVTASQEVEEIAPDAIPAGTRLVQLGAYDSPETARAEWGRLSGRFEEYLDGKARVIERASSGGKTFYRLRAHGFSDLSDARRFCAALVAGRADCIPVAAR